MVPKKIYLNYVEEEDFDNGAEITWCVDPVYVEDCEMQNREYTDLSKVWHPAEEEPQVGKQVIGIDYDGEAGCGVFDYRSMYGIFIYGDLILDWDSVVRWAYIDDLLPKGGAL